MKIMMITGSPHRRGSSAALAEQFERGAKEAGHTLERFDAGSANIHPCLGCERCGMDGPCVHHDDIAAMLPHLLDADLVVFVTPLYYFGVSAQLKMVIDRFYSINSRLQGKRMKSILLAAAWNSSPGTMDALESYYQTICDYLNLQDCGMVLGLGCGSPSMTARTPYPEQAYRLGKSLSSL